MSNRDITIKGVAVRHAEAIADVARAMNCFIFIRPSTDDTVRLIEAGFATKSNDVHDKSSDWGPMAGFVPIDQGLNKKNNSPSRGATRKAGYHAHGIEAEVHLKISAQLASTQPMMEEQGFDRRVVRSGGGFALAAPGAAGVQPFTIYRARKHAKPLFARHRDNGEIYWIDEASGDLIPVYVWGYHGVPITGDYDLWMVAPHISNADKFGLSSLVDIYTAVDEHKTPSAATPFLLRLNNQLNQACRKRLPGSKQVFNHGAEAQNYGFTQALDDQMAMFTPNGGFRNIQWTELADALNEMEHRGYLAIHNRKWTESNNPTLSGEKRTDGFFMWKSAIAAVRGGGNPIAGGVQQIAKMAVAKDELEKKRGRVFDAETGQYEWAEADKKKGYESRLAERHRLSLFGKGLRGLRAGGGEALWSLEPYDFPEKTRDPISAGELATLQGHAAGSTDAMTGAGANKVGHMKLDLTTMGKAIESSNSPFRMLERDDAARRQHIARVRAARGL